MGRAMPEFRPDLHTISKYRPGKPIDEVMRELGLTDIIKLASNELPVPPFPEVVEAVAAAVENINRYPETSSHYLRYALADHYGLTPDHFWIGAGSSQLIGLTVLAMGGPNRSVLYADPSFAMYPIATRIAGSDPIEVLVDDGLSLDLDAMLTAMRPDTRVVFICNPNNPTGTYLPLDAITEFVDSIDREVLVMVDEAYAEFATAEDFDTAIPLAVERPNVVVGRTFSKIYGLAGLRVGYFVGQPDTLTQLARVQPPFSVTELAQVAALEALQHQDRVADRIETNAKNREQLSNELAVRGVRVIPSQANFVLVQAPRDGPVLAQRLLEAGVIVRQFGQWIRITIGTTDEHRTCLDAWDACTG